MNKLKLFLKEYKVKNNPFLNKNFDICGMETFSEGSEIHFFYDIRLVYKWNSLKIKFLKKDYISAIYLFYLTVENNYAYDPNWKTYLNDQEFIYSFDYLINLIENKYENENEFKIIYSDNDNGLNAFEVAKQIIWYPVTEWKEDTYYFTKELNRWKK